MQAHLDERLLCAVASDFDLECFWNIRCDPKMSDTPRAFHIKQLDLLTRREIDALGRPVRIELGRQLDERKV